MNKLLIFNEPTPGERSTLKIAGFKSWDKREFDAAEITPQFLSGEGITKDTHPTIAFNQDTRPAANIVFALCTAEYNVLDLVRKPLENSDSLGVTIIKAAWDKKKELDMDTESSKAPIMTTSGLWLYQLKIQPPYREARVVKCQWFACPIDQTQQIKEIEAEEKKKGK